MAAWKEKKEGTSSTEVLLENLKTDLLTVIDLPDESIVKKSKVKMRLQVAAVSVAASEVTLVVATTVKKVASAEDTEVAEAEKKAASAVATEAEARTVG